MASNVKTQRGGFGVGLVVGLLVGLVLALGVALYVTKAPVPFIDKVPQRTAEQDAAEAEKNRHWDPNAPLHGRNPARPQPSAPATPAPADPPAAPTPTTPPPPAATASAPAPAPAAARASADPASASARPGVDPFVYFVQVGAYVSSEDAEQQRAKLAMGGMKARITEREQAGRIMYRVRLGPFDTREDAERVRDQTSASGYTESALVRVPR